MPAESVDAFPVAGVEAIGLPVAAHVCVDELPSNEPEECGVGTVAFAEVYGAGVAIGVVEMLVDSLVDSLVDMDQPEEDVELLVTAEADKELGVVDTAVELAHVVGYETVHGQFVMVSVSDDVAV